MRKVLFALVIIVLSASAVWAQFVPTNPTIITFVNTFDDTLDKGICVILDTTKTLSGVVDSNTVCYDDSASSAGNYVSDPLDSIGSPVFLYIQTKTNTPVHDTFIVHGKGYRQPYRTLRKADRVAITDTFIYTGAHAQGFEKTDSGFAFSTIDSITQLNGDSKGLDTALIYFEQALGVTTTNAIEDDSSFFGITVTSAPTDSFVRVAVFGDVVRARVEDDDIIDPGELLKIGENGKVGLLKLLAPDTTATGELLDFRTSKCIGRWIESRFDTATSAGGDSTWHYILVQ